MLKASRTDGEIDSSRGKESVWWRAYDSRLRMIHCYLAHRAQLCARYGAQLLRTACLDSRITNSLGHNAATACVRLSRNNATRNPPPRADLQRRIGPVASPVLEQNI